jgi:glycosyltransferase involved in cell wall biosynthesis
MKILLLIPCYNEEDGIGTVLRSIPYGRLAKHGHKLDVLVIDNNSKDKTAEVASRLGAKVISEKKQGKGHAIITGFRQVTKDYQAVVMIDGDASYDISELPRLLELIQSNFCEVVVGTRLQGKMTDRAMTYFNRTGNWLFTFLARVGYKTNVTDVCSGFFVWRTEVILELRKYLQSNSFSIEMEMVAKMARMGYKCYSVPISYIDRAGTSSLRPIKDGSEILHAWIRNLTWKPVTMPRALKPLAPEVSLEEAQSYYGMAYAQQNENRARL